MQRAMQTSENSEKRASQGLSKCQKRHGEGDASSRADTLSIDHKRM
jgi:hypothetical protein